MKEALALRGRYGDEKSTNSKQLHKQKNIIHQRLRIRRLDGEKDGRATARIYRIAPNLERLSNTELGGKQHVCTLDVDKREAIFGRLW